MAFDFPNSPSVGTVYTSAGVSWTWNGTAWAQVSPAALPGTAEARNRIVNPVFQISQENGIATGTAQGYYFADNWYLSQQQGGTVTAARLDTPGSANGAPGAAWLRATVADAAVAIDDRAGIIGSIEGVDIADLLWGAASARSVVVRFTAYCQQGGTFCLALRDWPAAVSYVAPFTLPAGVWTDVVIPIPGPTVGTWGIGAAGSIAMNIQLMCGTQYHAPSANAWVSGNYFGIAGMTNFMAVLNNDFRVVNVGFYKDANNTGVPPPFETPDYAETLRKCQRYWQTSDGNYAIIAGYNVAGSAAYDNPGQFKVSMRAAPAIATGSVGYANSSALGSIAATTFGFRAAITITATGGGYATFTWTANARM